SDAEQLRTLRRPVSRGARPVLLARQHDQRNALFHIADRGVVNRHLLAGREMHGPRALRPGYELVAEAYVRERSSHHHLVVAAARAIRVEVLALYAVLDQVEAGRAVRADRVRG